MKKLSAGLLACCLPLAALAGCGGDSTPSAQTQASATPSGPIQFVDGYMAGWQLARQTNKPMLLFFTASWCTYCHQMADEVFTQQAVADLAARFVCVRIDADVEPAVCQQFRVQGYPTVQFVSPHGAPLNRVVGKQPAQQFIAQMQAALQSVARRAQWNDAQVR